MSATSIQLVRHATLKIAYGDAVVLVDPMLANAAAYPAVPDSPSPQSNPLMPLRMGIADVLDHVNLVLVTHTHRDHWDDAAVKVLPRSVALCCQPPDESKIAEAGFSNVSAIDQRATALGIEIARTGGQHGLGEVGRRMAPVSGFVLRRTGLPTIYIAGDTVWCEEVEAALRQHAPDIIIVNAGAAQFNAGGPITMDADSVASVVQAAPDAQVIAVHMECWNHCVLTRAALASRLQAVGLDGRVLIPLDGEQL